MDDDLDLLRDPDDGGGGAGAGGPARRPWGLLAAALAAVLVAVAGLVWVVGSLTDGDTDVVPAAASPTVTTAAPTTTPEAAPTTTAATTTTTAPSPTATTRAPAPPLPTLSPTPRATPTPRPTSTRPPTLPPLPPRPGVRVPDVVGLRVPTATITLRSAGFRVAVPGGAVTPRPDKRRVRAQTPTAGTLAPKGSTVTLLLDSS